jgi:hypothetical protein
MFIWKVEVSAGRVFRQGFSIFGLETSVNLFLNSEMGT